MSVTQIRQTPEEEIATLKRTIESWKKAYNGLKCCFNCDHCVDDWEGYHCSLSHKEIYLDQVCEKDWKTVRITDG